MDSTPDEQFARLAPFVAVPFAEATEKYDLERFTEDVDFSDMFGDPPETVFVASGNVKLAEIKLDTAQYAGVYIIDGNLVVDGAFEFAHADGAAVLCVIGSVTATSLSISDEAHLWVTEDLTVEDEVTNDLSDAGSLQVLGDR